MEMFPYAGIVVDGAGHGIATDDRIVDVERRKMRTTNPNATSSSYT